MRQLSTIAIDTKEILWNLYEAVFFPHKHFINSLFHLRKEK